MDSYLILKLAHIIGACVLFGTGLGIAFFMWMANRTADPAVIAGTARIVVIADKVFTATAAIAQPVTGASLAYITAIPLQTPWSDDSSLPLSRASQARLCSLSWMKTTGSQQAPTNRCIVVYFAFGSCWAGRRLRVSSLSSC
jgi:uncharacterized membrane protein